MRSSWKGPFVDVSILSKLFHKRGKSKRDPIVTHSRSSIILPSFEKKLFCIHNGCKYFFIRIRNEHLGYRLGELVYTKRSAIFKKKKNKKKKNFK